MTVYVCVWVCLYVCLHWDIFVSFYVYGYVIVRVCVRVSVYARARVVDEKNGTVLENIFYITNHPIFLFISIYLLYLYLAHNKKKKIVFLYDTKFPFFRLK